MKRKIILTAILWTALSMGSWFSWVWQNLNNIIKDTKKDLKENLSIEESYHKKNFLILPQNNKINYDSLLNTNINNLTTEELRKYTNHYINQIRKKAWLSSLQEDITANKVAQDYSKYLYKNKMDDEITYEDHFDVEWNSVLERVRSAGMNLDSECRWKCKKVWENLASSNMTIKHMVDLWMESPSHKQNILWNSFDCLWIWHFPWSNNVVVIFVNLNNYFK